MNAAEAGAVLLEEPNWQEVFDNRLYCQDTGTPIELREDVAYDHVLHEYRKFHFTWLPNGMRRPAPASDANIALAKLRIFAPRSRNKNIERDGQLHEIDHDDHCWFQVAGRAWFITGIEDKTIFLHSFGEDMQLDIAHVNWNKEGGYVDRRVEVLKAAWPK